ncbi:MAG: terminase large subunit [Caudoviricetes sp.]|nr:MAG: terminase large subunit [Caudoviricetes sp.]
MGTEDLFSEKQRSILAFKFTSYDSLICDGAIRSGKTTIMMIAFVDWAMENFSGQRFGVCGKTFGSATENIIVPYISTFYAKKRYMLNWRRSTKILEVRRGPVVNYFEVFGGKDESSYALIQGRTLAGVLLDEVVLMPQSFVNQALARCSVEGSRSWFSCNPDNPLHWFKQEWIDKREEHNALRLHFTLDDNPSLSEKKKEQYRRDFTGVFYDRYVLGKWVAAEGLVYPMFDRYRHVLTAEPPTEGDYYVSSDYGIQNPNVFLLWRKERGTSRWICLKEDYYSGREEKHQLTDSQLVDRLDTMLSGIKPRLVIIDPSAASMKAGLRRRGYHTRDANNTVLEGISDVCSMLGAGNLAFMPCCENTIKEFGAYLWDTNAIGRGEDAPLKENDHCLTGDTLVDTLCGPVRIDELVGKCGFVYCTDGKTKQDGFFDHVRMTQKEAEIFEVTLADGRCVKATADHPILTRRGWVQIKDLRSDDEIACIGGLHDESGIQRRQENSVL